MLVACASLLEVTKSALADVVVLQTETRIALDQLDAEVKPRFASGLDKILARPRLTANFRSSSPRMAPY